LQLSGSPLARVNAERLMLVPSMRLLAARVF
jgi:hypothetical protein